MSEIIRHVSTFAPLARMVVLDCWVVNNEPRVNVLPVLGIETSSVVRYEPPDKHPVDSYLRRDLLVLVDVYRVEPLSEWCGPHRLEPIVCLCNWPPEEDRDHLKAEIDDLLAEARQRIAAQAAPVWPTPLPN